jgi:hypothetical protein
VKGKEMIALFIEPIAHGFFVSLTSAFSKLDADLMRVRGRV